MFPRVLHMAPETSTPGSLSAIHVHAADGTKIALDVMLPTAVEGTTFSTVLIMTRYWRATKGGTTSWWSDFFLKHNLAVISGDVRGTGASFGQWPYHRSRAEINDFDAIMDWIVTQPWSDGRIIGAGVSYTANTADWMAERQHPALKAIISRFADYDPYTDLYFPGGVPNNFGKMWGLMVKDLDQNLRRLKDGKLSPGVRPVDGSDGERLLQAALDEHSLVPSVWQGIQQIIYRDDRPQSWHGASLTEIGICSHAERVVASGVPIQNWASWMDAATANGAIHRFLALQTSLHVIIGPWSHGGSHRFDLFQPENHSIQPTYAAQQTEDLMFIEESLEGEWKAKEKRLSYFTYGEGRWKTTTVWPPQGTCYEDWYLSPENTLSSTQHDTGIDLYKVDFGVGTGKTTRWSTNQGGTQVSYGDRREMDKRLLCYTSTPLEFDIEMTGHPVLTLYMTSTEEDGAIFGYLELVAPDGTVIYLTEGQLRAIHRRTESDEKIYPHVGPYHSFLRRDTMPLIPGEVAEISFGLNPISVRVPAGYCLRLAIAGADVDVFARVPAVGDPTLKIHRTPELASRITIPYIVEHA